MKGTVKGAGDGALLKVPNATNNTGPDKKFRASALDGVIEIDSSTRFELECILIPPQPSISRTSTEHKNVAPQNAIGLRHCMTNLASLDFAVATKFECHSSVNYLQNYPLKLWLFSCRAMPKQESSTAECRQSRRAKSRCGLDSSATTAS